MTEYYEPDQGIKKIYKEFISAIEKSLLSKDIPIDYARSFCGVDPQGIFADYYARILIEIMKSPTLVKRLENRKGVEFSCGNKEDGCIKYMHRKNSPRVQRRIEDAGGVYKPSKESALQQVQQALKDLVEIKETQHTVGRPQEQTIDEKQRRALARLKKRKEMGII